MVCCYVQQYLEVCEVLCWFDFFMSIDFVVVLVWVEVVLWDQYVLFQGQFVVVVGVYEFELVVFFVGYVEYFGWEDVMVEVISGG